MNSKIQNLHENALEISARFHKAESELIDILQKLDQERIYLHLGFSSLFDYSVKALKLSEANSSNFITVARKSKTIPELKVAIEKREISVSKARKITPVLTKDNSHHWLELARTLPKKSLEKEVARVMPQALTIEKAKYVTESRLEVKLGVSEELMKKLRRAQDLTCQKTKKAASLEETLSEILDIYLQKQDPVIRAKRNSDGEQASIAKAAASLKSVNIFDINNTEEVKSSVNAAASVPGTRYIPSQIKHQVILRDQGQCSHINLKGEKCSNGRWLEIHHKIPLSKNGTNHIGNLQTLCSAHHRQQHLFG